jgi:uncharacterized protein (TIGR02246 family)
MPAAQPATGGKVLEELLAIERAALDRWVRFDPEGYLAAFAPDVSYFDPTTERRVDGLDAMRKRLEPIKKMTPPFTDPRYEIIGPKVEHQGDLAVLTFNVVNYGRVGGKPEAALSRWNSTEVYRRSEGRWRIVHSHWSRTQPDSKPAPI